MFRGLSATREDFLAEIRSNLLWYGRLTSLTGNKNRTNYTILFPVNQDLICLMERDKKLPLFL
jgi:hypothetical protein